MNTCKNCGAGFEITDWDRDFYQRVEVPEPVDCPKCRLIRRLSERNAKNLYYRQCDFSGKQIISQYDVGVPFPVYEKKIWWGDDWDPTEYGRDFDFDCPFFEQFYELWKVVPRMSLFISGDTLENSDYVNCAGYLKNCYLIGEADYDEDCYFSNRVFHSKNVVDCSTSYNNEICYECIACLNSHRLFYSQECKNCNDSYFLFNCISCQDCIGCINQRQKRYMIFNKQYTKEDYEKYKSAFELSSKDGVEKLRIQCEAFFESQIHRDLIEEQNQNCVGDHLYNSKNCSDCFDCKDLEDCKYCVRTFEAKDCMDHTSWGDKSELVYECVSCGDNMYNIKFCSNCLMNCSNLECCQHLTGSQDCFGCVGLKRKKFCILNKQYSEQEYFVLKKKIIEHMKKTGEYGLFFPKKFASHGYNATLAQDEFPLSKEEALANGFQWTDPIEMETQDAVGDAMSCLNCKKKFRLISQELEFYKSYGIPHPDLCPICRHRKRQDMRNPIELWDRECAKCGAGIKTSYSPKRPERVYCETCYLAEVY